MASGLDRATRARRVAIWSRGVTSREPQLFQVASSMSMKTKAGDLGIAGGGPFEEADHLIGRVVPCPANHQQRGLKAENHDLDQDAEHDRERQLERVRIVRLTPLQRLYRHACFPKSSNAPVDRGGPQPEAPAIILWFLHCRRYSLEPDIIGRDLAEYWRRRASISVGDAFGKRPPAQSSLRGIDILLPGRRLCVLVFQNDRPQPFRLSRRGVGQGPRRTESAINPLRTLHFWREMAFGFRCAGLCFRCGRPLILLRRALISLRRPLNLLRRAGALTGLLMPSI